MTLDGVLRQIAAERERQDAKWGGAGHDDEHDRREWLGVLREHIDRATKAVPLGRGVGDLDEYRNQLIQIAALAVAAVQVHDREVHADRGEGSST